MNDAKIQQFFEDFSGRKSSVFYALPQSGSARKNFVGEDGEKKFIITYNDNLRENEAFFYFSDLFSELKLNTPKVFKISGDRKLYIQEFLGENTLSQVIEKEGLTDNVKSLVKKSLKALFELQTQTLCKIDFSKTFEYESYNELPVFHDLNYFKFMFVDILELPYHKSTLLKEFRDIVFLVEQLQPKVIMVRDFQARNIMIDENHNVFFIDYQSAMEGPAMYDVISFLYQAKANFPENFRQEMLNYYFSFWKDEEVISKLKLSVKPIQLMRFLQVLGAYGFRGLVQKKAHFIKSIDKGVENISYFAEHWDEMKNYPELHQLIKKIASEETSEKIKKIIN